VVRIAAMAEAGNADQTVVVVMTTGEENVSQEATPASASTAIDRLQAHGAGRVPGRLIRRVQASQESWIEVAQ
jgi:hypothetical protein